MAIFNSDNVTGACPEVMEALIAANSGVASSYGNDKWSSNLQSKFQLSYKDIEDDKFDEVVKYIEFLKKNPS